MSDVFRGKKVLITGASKGLGKAAAVAFERKGAKLALAARSGEKLDALTASFSDPDKHLVFGIVLFRIVIVGMPLRTIHRDKRTTHD